MIGGSRREVRVAGVESVMGCVALAGLDNPREGCGLFAERVLGSHGHLESRGVTGSDFSFSTSLWLLSGERPVGGESEAEDRGGVCSNSPSEGRGSIGVRVSVCVCE